MIHRLQKSLRCFMRTVLCPVIPVLVYTRWGYACIFMYDMKRHREVCTIYAYAYIRRGGIIFFLKALLTFGILSIFNFFNRSFCSGQNDYNQMFCWLFLKWKKKRQNIIPHILYLESDNLKQRYLKYKAKKKKKKG